MSAISKDIGIRIKESRKAQKVVTQQKMADALNVSRQTIIDMENGKTDPKVKHLEAISKIIDRPVDWILTGDNPTESFKKIVDSTPEDKKDHLLNEFINIINQELGGKPCGEE